MLIINLTEVDSPYVLMIAMKIKIEEYISTLPKNSRKLQLVLFLLKLFYFSADNSARFRNEMLPSHIVYGNRESELVLLDYESSQSKAIDLTYYL